MTRLVEPKIGTATDKLAAIDADTGMSRTLRETFLALFDALGKPAPRFVADKETEAVALRAEIASEDIQEILPP